MYFFVVSRFRTIVTFNTGLPVDAVQGLADNKGGGTNTITSPYAQGPAGYITGNRYRGGKWIARRSVRKFEGTPEFENAFVDGAPFYRYRIALVKIAESFPVDRIHFVKTRIDLYLDTRTVDNGIVVYGIIGRQVAFTVPAGSIADPVAQGVRVGITSENLAQIGIVRALFIRGQVFDPDGVQRFYRLDGGGSRIGLAIDENAEIVGPAHLAGKIPCCEIARIYGIEIKIDAIVFVAILLQGKRPVAFAYGNHRIMQEGIAQGTEIHTGKETDAFGQENIGR